MELELSGKVAIVTGAGRGIGLAVAQAFAAAGAHVVAGSLSVTSELTDLVNDAGATALALDLSKPEAPEQLLQAAGDQVDVLVNNVGIAPPRLDGFLSITDEMWQHTFELNLMTPIRMLRAALPALVRSSGVVVNIGSLNARLPDPTVIDYSASKAALGNLAKSLSKEFGPHGVRINTIDPGPVATDLWLGPNGVAAQLGAKQGRRPDAVAAAAAAGMVTGRFSRPAEVADLVLFLASARAANITGSNMVIDGGMVTTI
jgi:NAD(P)-dependent dehydrogenase (short-subunit alcohol dehydrogenase family)